MLSQLLADHVVLHRALGFKFRTQGSLLRNFVAFVRIPMGWTPPTASKCAKVA